VGPPRRPDADLRLEHVLLSDVHLNEILEERPPGWWEYKGPDSRQDRDLVGLLTSLEARRPAAYDATEVIFNGDTFEFDLVQAHPAGADAPVEGLPPTSEASVFKIQRILADHPELVHGLARFLAAGNRVVFVMGNHDRELCYPEVQAVLRTTVARAAPPGYGETVAAAIRFEPWFVYRPGVLYAEHGQQYDATCSYRDVLDPVVPADLRHAPEVETNFGSLIGRHTLNRLGTFNPYNDESFILSLGGYLRHWLDNYWPKRSFFTAYFLAVWHTLWEIFSRGRRASKRKGGRNEAQYLAYARAQGVDPGFIAMAERLASRPIIEKPRLVIHELWLDRFAFMFAALALIISGILMVKTWPQALLLLVLVPAFVFVFRAMGRGSLALQERARWGLVAEQIATHLRVPVVCFGHSHRPERRPLTGGGRYYNLGSWAPVLEADRGSTLWRARRFLVLRPRVGGPGVYAVFGRWDHDRQGTVG